MEKGKMRSNGKKQLTLYNIQPDGVHFLLEEEETKMDRHGA